MFEVFNFEKLKLFIIKVIDGLMGFVNCECLLILWIWIKWLCDVLVLKLMLGVMCNKLFRWLVWCDNMWVLLIIDVLVFSWDKVCW